VAPFGDGIPGELDVTPPVGRVGQEVEHGPVVPDIERPEIRGCRYVGDHPANPLGPLAEPGSRRAEGDLGDIEDGDFSEGEVKEPIDQDRGPAAHVDDSRALGGSDGPDEFHRESGLLLMPAHACLGLRRVDGFPEGSAVGCAHGAMPLKVEL
jgi:hypothetical protein